MLELTVRILNWACYIFTEHLGLVLMYLTLTGSVRFETDFAPLKGCENGWIQSVNITEKLNVSSSVTCTRACARTKGCSGVNYCRKSEGKYCEMLGYTVNVPDVQCSNLSPESNCTFYKRLQCLNGGRMNLDKGVCVCAIGFTGLHCEKHWQDCSLSPHTDFSQLVVLQPFLDRASFTARCKDKKIVIARRGTTKKAFFKNKTWQHYRAGFVPNKSHFWIGLENMYTLFQLRSFDLVTRFIPAAENDTYLSARYTNFRIENETMNYTLRYDSFRGTSNYNDDTLGGTSEENTSRDRPFCAPDKNCGTCATTSESGWWFGINCSYVNLNTPDPVLTWPVNGTFVALKMIIFLLL